MLVKKIVVDLDLKKAIMDFVKYGRFIKLEILEFDKKNVNGDNITVYQRLTPQQFQAGQDPIWMGNGRSVVDNTKPAPKKKGWFGLW